MVLLLPGPGALALHFLSFLGFFLPLVNAGIVNRTIDDSFGDSQTGQLVTYVPALSSKVWKDETCVGCAINPDVGQAFKQTYTAATYNPTLGNMSITMRFNGTAIYVFFILANNQGDGITTLTLANFTMDGNAPQLFQHAPDLTSTALEYNQLVFSQTNLINAEHTLVISTSGVNTNVYVNFDYAIYTHDDDAPLLPLPAPGSSSSSSSSSSISTSATRSSTRSAPSLTSSPTTTTKGSTTATDSDFPTSSAALGQDSLQSNGKSTPAGAIAGGVIGGLAILILLALLLLWRMRRGKTRLIDARSAENGYVPPLMAELDPSEERPLPPAPGIDPFITQNYLSTASRNNLQHVGSGQGHTSAASQNTTTSPVQDSLYGAYAYDGIADSSSDGQRRPGESTASSSVLAYYGNGSRVPLRSITSGDHLSSPNTDLTTPSYRPGRNSDNVEDIRRVRQEELNQRLRTVQEEMAFLASDLTGEKTRPQSVRRRRTVTRPTPGGGGTAVDGEEEGDMSMAEMREQLQMLRDQVSYLREQQRSDWAQGLSDDPPPGYTPASPSAQPTHSLPPIPGE